MLNNRKHYSKASEEEDDDERQSLLLNQFQEANLHKKNVNDFRHDQQQSNTNIRFKYQIETKRPIPPELISFPSFHETNAINDSVLYDASTSRLVNRLHCAGPSNQNQFVYKNEELNDVNLTNSHHIGLGELYKRATDFVYYNVQPDDTLHNISVRYSCPVASIKRLNNLFSEQEFFGLTRLKLPVGKLRLLENVIDGRSDEQSSDVASQHPRSFPTNSQPHSSNATLLHEANTLQCRNDHIVAEYQLKNKFHNDIDNLSFLRENISTSNSGDILLLTLSGLFNYLYVDIR